MSNCYSAKYYPILGVLFRDNMVARIMDPTNALILLICVLRASISNISDEILEFMGG